MATETTPAPISLQTMLREGGRIAAILLFWGILATIARYGVGNVGLARPGHVFFEIGTILAALFVVTGVASILIYVIARGLQLSRH